MWICALSSAFALLTVLLPLTLFGGTISSAQSGSWTEPATWVGGVVPGQGDSVYALNGHQITIESSESCSWLSILGEDAETGVGLVPGGELVITGDALVYAPVTIQTSGYLNCGSGRLTVGGNVTLVGGATANLHAKLEIEDGQTTVRGDIIMNNTRARITFRGNGTLFIGGSLSGSGVLNPSNGTVVFASDVPQGAAGYTYYNLTIDNPNGVTLEGSATVNGILSLTSGVLSIGEYDLRIGTADSIAGASVSSYVGISGAGRLRRDVDSTGAKLFPVGTGSAYNPVGVRTSTGADNFGVGVLEPVVPSTGNDDLFVLRTWVVSQSAPGSTGPVSLWFQWNAADEGTLFDRASAACWRHDGVSWLEEGPVSSLIGADPVIAEITPVADLGSFTIGSSTTTTVSDGSGKQPAVFFLSQNYPNPFNPSTRIHFTVDHPGGAELSVFNVIGQKVATVFSGQVEAGKQYSFDFDASGLGSGLYFYTLKTDQRQETHRMVLMR